VAEATPNHSNCFDKNGDWAERPEHGRKTTTDSVAESQWYGGLQTRPTLDELWLPSIDIVSTDIKLTGTSTDIELGSYILSHHNKHFQSKQSISYISLQRSF
jgi:hypothetical protein